MDALVTGAGGFLGQYIVERLLSRGDRVRALGRKQYPELQARGVEFIHADLCDRDSVVDACRSVDVVFHVAGIAGLGGRWQDFYRINTLGTRWIIEGCRRHGVGRLVYTSSPSVIFDGNDQCGVDESAPYPRRWLCHYAHSKALAEQEVLSANGGNGLLTCVLRPHLIWGPRDRSLDSAIVGSRPTRPAYTGGRRHEPDRHHLCGKRRRCAYSGRRCASPGSASAGKAYFIVRASRLIVGIGSISNLPLAGLPPVRKIGFFCHGLEYGGLF